MPVDKFGRGSKKPSCVITKVIQSPASDEYVKKDGTSVLSGSLNMGGNKVKNVGEPSSDQDVATKAYVDSNSGARKILSGYIPPLLSDDSGLNFKTGFIVSASSSYGENYKPYFAFNSTYVRGDGERGEWATNGVYKNFSLTIECPDVVRVWKLALRGRNSNTQ